MSQEDGPYSTAVTPDNQDSKTGNNYSTATTADIENVASSSTHHRPSREPSPLINDTYFNAQKETDPILNVGLVTSRSTQLSAEHISNESSRPSLEATSYNNHLPSNLPEATNETTDCRKSSKFLRTCEVVILLIYPIIILLGQLVHVSQPEYTYFSNKKNIFNVFFVKRAWLWTSLAYIPVVARAKVVSTNFAFKGRPRALSYSAKHFIARYTIATLWWFLFTQWFFGLPIMDRVFVLSGGGCDGLVQAVGENLTSPLLNKIVSSAYCRSHGGTWVGGYDPSGHTFLLVHASLFLWFELLPLLVNGQSSTGNSTKSLLTTSLSIKLVLGLLAFWAWMVLMTAVYFHSFIEKLMGLFCGYIEILLVYFLAGNYPQLQAVFGV